MQVKTFAKIPLTPPSTPPETKTAKQKDKLANVQKSLKFRFQKKLINGEESNSSSESDHDFITDAKNKTKVKKVTKTMVGNPVDKLVKTEPKRKRTTSTAKSSATLDTTTASTSKNSNKTSAKKRGTSKKSKFDSPPAKNKSILDFFTKTPKPVNVLDQPGSEVNTKPLAEEPKPIPIPIQAAPTKATEEIETLTISDDDKSSSTVHTGKRKRQKGDPKIIITRARRKLCPGTDLKMVSNRYHDQEQKRLEKFYDKTKEAEFGYHTTVSQSKAPVIIDGNMDVEQFLQVDLAEQSQVICLQRSQRDNFDPPMSNFEELMDRIENPRMDDDDIDRERWNMEEYAVAIENVPIDEESRADSVMSEDITSTNEPQSTSNISNMGRPKKGRSGQKRTLICPKYKFISGTSFVVDAFRFGKIDGATHYFLTHFHSDHYIGLKKTFDMPLICSSITARLVDKFIHVNPQYITVLDVGQSIVIDDIEVHALDANHCPGAVMFLFKFPNGDTTLHVGDFRASVEMESNPLFWNYYITELYLDTTYYNCQYNLMTQEQCIAVCLEETKKFLEKNNFNKPLIVIGGYLVGKEKVWINIAKEFKLKVWADKNRRLALDAINDPEMMKHLVDSPNNAQIHLVALGLVYYDDMKQYLNNFPDIFSHVLGIRPSGWEKKSRPRHQGAISIVGVEYSEHSSYDELKRFVGFLRPKTIISTVPCGKDLNKTPTIPASWYSGELKPVRDKETAQPKVLELLSNVKKSNWLEAATSTPVNKLNPSARKRRAEMNKKVKEYQVLEEIQVLCDSDVENQQDTEDTDFLL